MFSIPITNENIYGTLGLDLPPGINPKDVFIKPKPQPIMPMGGRGSEEPVPSDSGETTQRHDRESEDSDIPDDDTRKQDKNNDLRTADKEKDGE
jgi:hypothetical protein